MEPIYETEHRQQQPQYVHILDGPAEHQVVNVSLFRQVGCLLQFVAVGVRLSIFGPGHQFCLMMTGNLLMMTHDDTMMTYDDL